ncbi:MAG: SH3 domain-containing protein [Rhizobium sp.]|nr:SH3 domain-containing protein [Rhizobium sp.]
MDRHRTFWLGIILVAALGAGLPARPAHADYVGGLNPAGDNFLALRTGPGSRFQMILPMGPGTELTVIGRDGRWLNVELPDGTRGWAYDAYVFGGAAPDDGLDGPPPDMAPPDMDSMDPGSPPPPLDLGDDAPPSDMGGDPWPAETEDAEQPSDIVETNSGETDPVETELGNTDPGKTDNAAVPADPMASNWITYRNDRFGTRIDYSAPMFRMLPPPENGDGRTFEARDGSARFLVFGSHNVFDSTLDELIEEHLAGLGEDETVTRKRRGENWYLHSGFRGGDFFLRKVVLSDDGGVIHTFEISYAKSLKARLDPMAARMADSLRTADEGADSQGQQPATTSDADLPEETGPAGEDGARSMDAAGATAGDGKGRSATDLDGWTTHAFEGFALKAPQDWKKQIDGDTLTLKAPDGKRSLMVWWWFPDEPLLGYNDIVSNRKIRVAGQAALWIHTRFEGIEALSVTLDEGRADKKRLHFLFEDVGGGRLGGGDPDFDRILESVTIDGQERKAGVGDGKQPLVVLGSGSAAATLPDAATVDGAAADDVTQEDDERRAWVGRASVAVPTGWQVKPDEDIAGGIVMTRPDEGARIALSLWPKDKPMPSDEVASMDYTVMMGRPATVLELAEGRMRGRQVFFDEPRGDGARLTLAYRAFGEDLADGLPLFEMVLASLDETLPPPEGTEVPAAAPASGADPFADFDLSDLEVNPR